MSDKYKTEAGKLYYVTLTVVGWIDVFTRNEYVYDLMKNIKYCQENKGLELYAYVIMSNQSCSHDCKNHASTAQYDTWKF